MENAAPDWLLTSIKDRGPGTYYRYSVELLNIAKGAPGEYASWSLRDLNDQRYAPHPDASPEVAEALVRARSQG